MMKIIQQIKQNYVLLIILAVAAFLRFYHADFQSPWLDEILSMNNSNPSLTFEQFYDGIMFWEFIPHLYFLMLRYVFEILGYSVLVGRIFSASIGIAGVYAIYLLARELFNRRSGLAAAAVLAVNSFHITYSQEIRPYGLLFLVTVLAFYRLAIFIRTPNIRNAIYFGLFTGLIIHAHFFGAITIFAIYLIVLLFICQSPTSIQKKFFINAAISGAVALVVFIPAFEPMVRVSEITSFWLQKPRPDAFSAMFREFFGGSEIVLFFVQMFTLFYLIRIFNTSEKRFSREAILENRQLFAFEILFVWLFVSLIIPLVRSYLSVPMILSRYFMNILPVFVLIVVAGIAFIKNKALRAVMLSCFLLFSVIDLFVVRKYYTTPVKTQFRELSAEISARNPAKSKIVAYWTWLFPYFFRDDPQQQIDPNSISLEDYVGKLKLGSAPVDAFWYADANSRPLTLTPEAQAYLNENFIVKEKLQFLDAWANYYVPKNAVGAASVSAASAEKLHLGMFGPAKADANGQLFLFENASLHSGFIPLQRGKYELIVSGTSQPSPPIDGENAHFIARVNGKEIGQFNLSHKPDEKEIRIPFTYDGESKARFQLVYDNDFFKDGRDRNVVLYGIRLEKKQG